MIGKALWKKYSFPLAILGIILVGILIINNSSLKILSTNDEQISFFASNNLLKNNTLEIPDNGNLLYGSCLFSSFSYSLTEDNRLYYTVYPSTAVFYAYFMSFNEQYFFYLPYLFFTLIILLTFFITQKIYQKRVISLLAGIIVTCFPFFLKFNLAFFDMIPTVFFLLMSFYMILISKNRGGLFLAGLFFTCAIFLRLSEIVFFIPFLIFLCLNEEKKSSLLYFSIPVIVFVTIIPLVNLHYFNNLFYLAKTNANFYACSVGSLGSINLEIIDETLRYFYAGSEKLELIFFHFYFFIKNILYFTPILLVLIVTNLFFLIKTKKFKLLLFSLSLLVMTILLYGHSNNYYGYNEFNLQSSFLRYILFPSIILIVSSLSLFDYWKDKKSLIIFLFLLVSLTFISVPQTYSFERNGVSVYNQIRLDHQNVSQSIEEINKPGNIIYTTYFTDKYLSPTYGNRISLEKFFVNEKITPEEIITDLYTFQLNNTNANIYFLVDESNDDKEVADILSEYYTLHLFKEFKTIIIYRLSIKNPKIIN